MTGRDQVSEEDPAPGRLARRLGLGSVLAGIGVLVAGVLGRAIARRRFLEV